MNVRPVLAGLTLAALLSSSVTAVVAQSETDADGDASSATELPVADYWGEWSLHKSASRERLRGAIYTVGNARSGRAGYLRDLVGVHNDELAWLRSHQPEACYAGEFEAWRQATRKLHAIHKRAASAWRKGDRSSLERAARQRKPAIRQLNRVMSKVSDCVGRAQPVAMLDPFVGKWTAQVDFVGDNGFRDTSPRRLTIGENGRFVLRIPRNGFCRDQGHGLVPLVFQGMGHMVRSDRPEFTWSDTRADCYPRGKSRVNFFTGGGGQFIVHDDTADVLLIGAGGECYYRNKGGSPKDCAAFWRGTHAPVPPKVTLPDLVGLDQAAATSTLDGAGLVPLPREVHSDDVPAGEVISQSLAPGADVDAGRSIVYLVSLGPEPDEG